jgi:hypothetical protein
MKTLSEERDKLVEVVNPWNHFDVNSCAVLTFFLCLLYPIMRGRIKNKKFFFDKKCFHSPSMQHILRIQIQGLDFFLPNLRKVNTNGLYV